MTDLSGLRIGQGFDVHAFADERQLILGGCNIPYERGLSGHSDADVLLHALTDALLGALGRGDIGRRFPDNDPRYKDIDSRILLREVWQEASREGWILINCDCVVMAQEPKLASFIPGITESIAETLSTSIDRISVKATTTERLGFVGRKEGIAASAVALIHKPSC